MDASLAITAVKAHTELIASRMQKWTAAVFFGNGEPIECVGVWYDVSKPTTDAEALVLTIAVSCVKTELVAGRRLGMVELSLAAPTELAWRVGSYPVGPVGEDVLSQVTEDMDDTTCFEPLVSFLNSFAPLFPRLCADCMPTNGCTNDAFSQQVECASRNALLGRQASFPVGVCDSSAAETGR